ncbi:hypothetical protein NDU88_010812 [Pleurodeles waltl]|uniref:Uncharacterized protein n=1 Tax=Pleurodeles waltl TaxID=8319 RepID=A0AAV7S534_PLEWA|nr:hypothetical protein NDU88_010812 [Pleurodeles waltl]
MRAAGSEGRRRLALLSRDSPDRTPSKALGTAGSTPSLCQVSPTARSQAGDSAVTFSSGLGRPAPAYAPWTSARPRTHTGPFWSRPAVSISSSVVCIVVATLGNSRHRVWPTGFCQDR